MDDLIVSELYDPRVKALALFNNRKMSDVRFMVEGHILYGHKLVLAMGSPVFESMFFGQLREQREVIEIRDVTFIGFKNALRYIYGFEIDFKISQLYESYRAADKYLLHNFGAALVEYVRSRLSARSSCLIYDQLIKIGDPESSSLAQVRTMIIKKSKRAFESERFTQIDQTTLIHLLSFDKLSICEFHLFAAVCKWVDSEVRRQGLPVNGENRRRVFEPIKGYIVFTALTAEEIANSEEIAQMLTDEERGSLVLHRLNKENRLVLEPKTSRRARTSNSRNPHFYLY